MKDNNSKKCIFCKRSLTDEKLPVCHRCTQKVESGATVIGGIIVTAVLEVKKKKK